MKQTCQEYDEECVGSRAFVLHLCRRQGTRKASSRMEDDDQFKILAIALDLRRTVYLENQNEKRIVMSSEL